MEAKRFLIILAIALIGYFILGFVFNIGMFYLMGGIVGGTISEAFKAIGVDPGLILVGAVWVLLLLGVVFLFYRLNNTALKYVCVILIAALLYIIDMFVASIPYSYPADTENITARNNIIIGFLTFTRSVILSLIIYKGIGKN